MNFNFILASCTGYDMSDTLALQADPISANETIGSEYWL